MPLVPLPRLMRAARDGRYAVGYFESWNLESLQAVIDAAERTASPVIVGFSGEFLADPNRLAAERLALYGAVGKAACDAASVPCSLIFNESPFLPAAYEAMDHGFNVVMYVDDELDRAELVGRVAELTGVAHSRGIAVEAEHDELPLGRPHDQPVLTDPEEAADFVARTGVDALAVSVGNVHVMLDRKAKLDVEHVARLAEQVPAPLVLHGGTGIESSSLRHAVEAGITKVNFGSVLKERYLHAVSDMLARTATLTDPHDRLGRGFEHDIMVAGRLAVRDEVESTMDVLGCRGRAADRDGV